MKMKKIMIAAVAAAMAMCSAFADETEAKEKKKMPSTAKYFTSIVQAKKEAAKYDAPIFVVAVAKSTPMEGAVKKVLANKFFRELATKGFFVYTMRVELSKKEKEADAKTPKVMYEKLSADDKALLDVIERLVGRYRGEVDRVVLGCTHYPFVRKQIAQVLGDVTFFDGGAGTARQLHRLLEQEGLLCTGRQGSVSFSSSVDTQEELDLYQRFFNLPC